MAKSFPECERLLYPLVRAYRDCLAAQCEWARSVNVLEQKDVILVPLTIEQQQRLCVDARLELRGDDAVELAKRMAASGADMTLTLGALFLVGQIPPRGERAARRYCAPLLEVPMLLQRQLTQESILVEPEEIEFSVNYSLVSELLGGDTDDLDDRLSELAELVPDFPIDDTEFDTFWNGFRMIAPELVLSAELPPRRESRQPGEPSEAAAAAQDVPTDAVTCERVSRLEFVDFFIPRFPLNEFFHLLPATALILGTRSELPMTALSELAAMDGMPLHETAFGCVFDPAVAQPSCSPRKERVPVEDGHPLPLTPTQEAIVRSARTSPLTVVTGPPGTGKSYTITAIVLDALLGGQSVLVASQMDKAVEVVADMVERLAGSYAIARSGGRAAQRELADVIAHLTGPLNKLSAVPAAAIRGCSQRHRDLNAQLLRLEQRYRRTIELEQIWSESHARRERLEPRCTLPVRDLADRQVRRAAKSMAVAQRGAAADAGWLRRAWGRWHLARARRLLQIPLDWDASLDELDDLLLVHSLRLAIREAERTLKLPFPADSIWEDLADVERRRNETVLELLRLSRHLRLYDLVAKRSQRAALRNVATLLRRRRRDLKIGLQRKIPPSVLLQAFPAWACTSRTLCEILPATAGLFDVVVIDEASQCDPALACVALMRARRAVVVGDPHQLRHVCFLSRAREQAAFAQYGLPADLQERFRYRRGLFDIAADTVDQQSLFFLNEHFRSHPQVISFSNHRFYDDALLLMTSRPVQHPTTAIQVRPVDGRRDEGSSVNRREVAAVREIIQAVTAHAATGGVPSIGVVSPFRDQADAIRDELIKTLSSDVLERHELVVGTAHSLQGDEKDIVVFSTSIDPESHPASLRFLENPNLFNVAITRARRELIVVTSVLPEGLPAGLLRDFLYYALTVWTQPVVFDGSRGELEQKILERLRERGVELWPGFLAAGQRINLVATGRRGEVAVLCDGMVDHPEQPEDALLAQRRLVRAGWCTRRIPERTWQRDWYACCEHIMGD